MKNTRKPTIYLKKFKINSTKLKLTKAKVQEHKRKQNSSITWKDCTQECMEDW